MTPTLVVSVSAIIAFLAILPNPFPVVETKSDHSDLFSLFSPTDSLPEHEVERRQRMLEAEDKAAAMTDAPLDCSEEIIVGSSHPSFAQIDTIDKEIALIEDSLCLLLTKSPAKYCADLKSKLFEKAVIEYIRFLIHNHLVADKERFFLLATRACSLRLEQNNLIKQGLVCPEHHTKVSSHSRHLRELQRRIQERVGI